MSSIPEISAEMRRQMLITSFEVNMVGTWVGLNEFGQVEMRILTSCELLDLKEKYNDFKDIPAEYTIYTENDLPNEQ